MSFLKSMFGGGDEKAPPRQLEHPRDLDVGDLVKFKLYAPPLIQNDMFKVEEVNTLHYAGDNKEIEFVLRDSASEHTIFMFVEESEDGLELRLSVKLTRDIWEELFGADELSPVVDDERGHVVVKRLIDPDTTEGPLAFLSGWTAPEYIRESFAVRGYYHTGDYRNKPLPDTTDNCEELDYYGLESKDENYALEVEVYDSDTDVLVTMITDVSLIEEMWPAS